jgi:hypothetical protein
MLQKTATATTTTTVSTKQQHFATNKKMQSNWERKSDIF